MAIHQFHQRFGIDDSHWEINWWAIAAACVMFLTSFVSLIWPPNYSVIERPGKLRRGRHGQRGAVQDDPVIRVRREGRGDSVAPVAYMLGWILFGVALTQIQECDRTSRITQFVSLNTMLLGLFVPYFFAPRVHSPCTRIRDSICTVIAVVSMAILLTDVGFARSHPWNFLAWLLGSMTSIALQVARAMNPRDMALDRQTTSWALQIFLWAQIWHTAAWVFIAMLLSKSCITLIG